MFPVIITSKLNNAKYAWHPQAAALAMDETILDADQVENLIKFCPVKEEMELLKVRLWIVLLIFLCEGIVLYG